MSEYLLDCRLRNNLIWQAIRRQGFEAVQPFCRAHGLDYNAVNNLLNLRIRAVRKDGEWTATATRLADAVQVEPDLLFTEQQRITELPTNRAAVAISEKLAIAMATDPYELAVQDDLAKQVRSLLENLTSREKRIVEMRFFEGKSLQECGEKFDVTPERVRQIETGAIRKLRHPNNSARLRDFFDHDPLEKLP